MPIKDRAARRQYQRDLMRRRRSAGQGLTGSNIGSVVSRGGFEPPTPGLKVPALDNKRLTEVSPSVRPGVSPLESFLESCRARNLQPTTISFYQEKLSHAPLQAKNFQELEAFLLTVNSSIGNRHAHFRALRAFYTWREAAYGLANPMKKLKAPRLAKLILPSLTAEQVETLLGMVDEPKIRNRAIISLFVESGLRLSELASIQPGDIDYPEHTVRVIGKGRKERLASFGHTTELYLRAWQAEYKPLPEANIWGINKAGIKTMLARLEKRTGLPCNPHTFRRTFAGLSWEAGVDTLAIKELGGWESVQMVELYTRPQRAKTARKHYRPVLG